MLKPFLSLALGLSMLTAVPAAAQSFTDAQKKELEVLFKDYLLNNGQAVMESVQKFQIAEQERQMNEAKENLKNSNEYLYNSGSPSYGPEDADVTIVEFFDYNCGYCKKAFTELQDVLNSDKKVRVVFKEIPILSPASREAAQWALAANNQGKYFEYHAALMSHAGAKDTALLKKIGGDLGLDVTKLEADSKSAEVSAIIDKNLEMSQKLGVRGTPAFVVGEEFSPGYVPASELKRMIEEQRKKKG